MRLRRMLPAARIETRDPGYMLAAGQLKLDIAEFEALCGQTDSALRAGAWAQASDAAERALGVWRGTPLLDVPTRRPWRSTARAATVTVRPTP
jgi:hypothetical protein